MAGRQKSSKKRNDCGGKRKQEHTIFLLKIIIRIPSLVPLLQQCLQLQLVAATTYGRSLRVLEIMLLYLPQPLIKLAEIVAVAGSPTTTTTTTSGRKQLNLRLSRVLVEVECVKALHARLDACEDLHGRVGVFDLRFVRWKRTGEDCVEHSFKALDFLVCLPLQLDAGVHGWLYEGWHLCSYFGDCNIFWIT